MQIGTFVATADGFEGRLTILALHTELTLVPAEQSDSENAPDYRVLAGDWGDTREVGAGWKRIGEKAGAYVAVQIDDPMFAVPLRGNIFRGEGNGHIFVWSRPAKREPAN